MALPVFVLFPLFASTFTYFKAAIPLLHPFAWDARLAAWDEALHGGHAAWEWLQPIFGYPYATAVINVFYHLWFFVTYGVLVWQALSLGRPRLRMQYLLTTLLLWSLVGNLAATALSSAGPVYFGRVTGLADPFAPLMAYLHQANDVVPVMALQVQDMLWQAYSGNGADIGAGISAMPSLHVATTFSYALLGFAVRRWLGILLAGFAALIMIGSVHLGWHYALDGYAGILCTVLIWRAVGWVLDRPAVARLLHATP
jgi:membrane-associated phospholipid phosphatase